MKEVVITDVKYRMTLTAIWSLGKKKIPMTLVEYSNTKETERLGFYSKYATHKAVISNPKTHADLFIDELIEIAKNIIERSNQKPVLIVPGSAAMLVVTQNLELLEDYYDYNLVEYATYFSANNTHELIRIAEKVGVPTPLTTLLNDYETIEELSNRILYPVVIKYREGEKLPLKANERYIIIQNRDAFIKAYAKMHAIQPKPIVQEYIEGSGYGVSAVFDKTYKPIAIFSHERLREYPVSGGPSTFCKSIWDEKMVDDAIKLLEGLKWTGFAMVEFKGVIGSNMKLMEINPRFWGSMPLSLIAGSDLPYAYYQSLLEYPQVKNQTSQFNQQYKLNVRMQFVLQDILACRGYLKKNGFSIGEFFKYLIDFLNPNIKDGLFRLSDPMPGILYVFNIIKR